MMKTHAAMLLLAATLPMAACDAAPASDRGNTPAPASTSPESPAADAPPPSARDILRAGWGGTERGRYDVRRNVFIETDPATREVHETGVWHRLTFTSGGRRYFTGFTAASPGELDAAVALGQATFVLEGGRWRPVDSGFVAGLPVNATGNPATIDPDQSRVSSPYVLPDGRILFAIRMRHFAQGTSLESHAILLLDPRGMARTGKRKPDNPNGGWSLAAVLPTGSDNAAACDGGAVMTCAAESGSIRFDAAGAGLPDIRVQRAGTEITAPGKVRRLGPDDMTLYRFDPAGREYVVRRER